MQQFCRLLKTALLQRVSFAVLTNGHGRPIKHVNVYVFMDLNLLHVVDIKLSSYSINCDIRYVRSK